MARTVNGNYAGRAARIELAEQRDFLASDAARVANPNSDYWKDKCTWAIDELLDYDHLAAIWWSDLIPEWATYKRHYELATKYLQYKNVTPEYCVIPAFLEGSDNTTSGQWKEHGYH